MRRWLRTAGATVLTSSKPAVGRPSRRARPRAASAMAMAARGEAQRAGLCGRDGQDSGRNARGVARGDRPADERELLSLVPQGAAAGGRRRQADPVRASLMACGMTASFTILGSGSSGGVPRPALGWGACDPSNPRNRRRRTSLLVERRNGAGVTRVLVDTSPDLREQLLDAEVDWLDAVLFTHEHADHTHGIDDLRGLFIRRRRRVDVYLDETTSKALRARFGYCFEAPAGSEYPPIVTEHRLAPGRCVTVNGEGGPIAALPVLQEHGDIPSLGFRFGGLAYSCDLSGSPEASIAALAGTEVWIVDALRYRPHPSHFSVDDALAWIARIKPGRAILTNLHADLDYDELRSKLPPHVEPAFDGLRIEMPDDRLACS